MEPFIRWYLINHKIVNTMANDPGKPPTCIPGNQIFYLKEKLRRSVANFSFHFKVPKDINYQYGNGKNQSLC